MGPLGFPTWFDSLTRFLRDRGHGVAIGATVPQAWRGRCWRGEGTPSPGIVAQLAAALKAGSPVPPAASLDGCPSLEASALAALDQQAALRLALVLQADDPDVLASSAGAMSATLAAVAA